MQRHKEKIYGTKKSLTEKEIVAQCFIFFIAGFETTSSTITYTAFELANNPEVQERLYEEILRVVDPRVENYTSAEYYDKIVHQIPYLDAVIKETLRKYPPVPRLERRVTADSVKLNGVSLPRDTLVEISTVAVHYNPDYYEEPERYNPSRWMPENKHLLVPYTYLPFGEGPRNCVGMRFAYQEIKLALARLCTKYRFERASNTPQKLQFKKGSPLLMIPDMPIRVVRRDN